MESHVVHKKNGEPPSFYPHPATGDRGQEKLNQNRKSAHSKHLQQHRTNKKRGSPDCTERELETSTLRLDCLPTEGTLSRWFWESRKERGQHVTSGTKWPRGIVL